MNDRALNELSAEVERVVAAVPASRARKRQMREELLAHLLALYEEEFETGHDEAAARASALRRFGDLDELTSELGTAVPFPERLLHLLIGKGTVMVRWLLALGCVAVLVGLGLVFPAVAHLNGVDQEQAVGSDVSLLVLGLAVALAGLTSVVLGVRRLRMRTS